MTGLLWIRCANLECLDWFEPHNSRQKYCTLDCGEAARTAAPAAPQLLQTWERISLARRGVDPDAVRSERSEADKQAFVEARLRRAEFSRNADIAERWLAICDPIFEEADMAGVDQPDMIRAELEAWLSEALRGEAANLVLVGDLGTGKTYAAMAMARAIHFSGGHVMCSTVTELLKELQPEGRYELRSVRAAGVLFLDDAGVEKSSLWTDQTITELVDYRYRHKLPIVVTANLRKDELRRAFGARAFDRLQRDSRFLIFRGDSRRRPGPVISAQLSLYDSEAQ